MPCARIQRSSTTWPRPDQEARQPTADGRRRTNQDFAAAAGCRCRAHEQRHCPPALRPTAESAPGLVPAVQPPSYQPPPSPPAPPAPPSIIQIPAARQRPRQIPVVGCALPASPWARRRSRRLGSVPSSDGEQDPFPTRSRPRQPSSPGDEDAATQAQTLQWVFYGVGAGTAIAGGVLTWLGFSAAKHGAATTVALTPTLVPGGAGLSARGAF